MATEFVGSWWRPGHNEEIGGRLVIDDDGTRIQIFGSIADWSGHDFKAGVSFPAEVPELPMLFGYADGKSLTVVGLTRLSPRIPGSIGSETWLCEGAIEAHLEPDHSLEFSGIRAELEHLAAWMKAPGLDMKWDFGDRSIAIHGTSKELLSVDVAGAELSILEDLSYKSGRDQLNVRYPVSASFVTKELYAWRDLSEAFLTPLEALIWLAVVRLSPVEREWLRTSDGRWRELHASKIRPRSGSDARDSRRLITGEMLFSAADMPGGAAEGIRLWFERWPEVSHVLVPLLARDRSPFTYSDDRFTAAITAIEEYHRSTIGDDRDLPREEHRARVDQVAQIVQEHAPIDADWVRHTLQEANRISLRVRLLQIVIDAAEISDRMFADRADEFIEALLEARNDYAHGTRKSSKIQGGELLHWSARALRWLLQFAMLQRIGFTDSHDRILRYGRFSQESERIRNALRQAL